MSQLYVAPLTQYVGREGRVYSQIYLNTRKTIIAKILPVKLRFIESFLPPHKNSACARASWLTQPYC